MKIYTTTTPRVAFRVDADPATGGGHLMRCLVLAAELRDRGWETFFLTRAMSAPMRQLVESARFEVVDLPVQEQAASDGPLEDRQSRDANATLGVLADSPADWVVVDHYLLDAEWEQRVSTSVPRLLAIDDIGRTHRCDLLLDQNYTDGPDERYEAAAKAGTRLLLGPRYALLRPQFKGLARERRGPIRRLFVSFGASDPTGESEKVLEALLSFPEGEILSDVLVDPQRLGAETRQRVANRDDIRVHSWVDDVAALMSEADLAIGAGGISAWERCALGLPALVITVADNQRRSMGALARQGSIRLLGEGPRVSPSDVRQALLDVFATPEAVRQMSRRAIEVGQSGSGAGRVADEMEGIQPAASFDGYSLRKMTPDDLELVLQWRNQDRVRQVSLTQHEIGWAEHVEWFSKAESDGDSLPYVFELARRPVGVLAFKGVRSLDHLAEWSFYIGEADAPRGSGTRMLALGLDLAFSRLGILTVRARVLASNTRSIDIHTRLGFRQETCESLDMAHSGDVVCLRLDRDQWISRRSSVLSDVFQDRVMSDG